MFKIFLALSFFPRAIRECFDRKQNFTIESCINFLPLLLIIIIFVFVAYWMLQKKN
jgi:hypothetical protein